MKTVRKIHVTGVVQGVGFRPFVFKLATGLGLQGWVANTSSGVDIELEGELSVLDTFLRALTDDQPPLARIDSVAVQDDSSDVSRFSNGFEIHASIPQPGEFQPVSPDISICADCLRELFDPHDRRYRYPFINCTNCGPRFTIIRDIPYDRPLTTMHAFEMCPDCAREYHDPLDRRFHAQPVACPKCGPQVWLAPNPHLPIPELASGLAELSGDAALLKTRALLGQGYVVAIKGLGGFHLVCDGTNEHAVQSLRERKGRVDKPFALMAFDAAAVEEFCFLSDAERTMLESRERPIVLLRRRPDASICEAVAPNNNFLGVMLPYTPLHYMLLADDAATRSAAGPLALVMTSGNRSEEPIAIENVEAQERLAELADCFLLHNRDIETRVDDSVIRVFEDRELPVRRSRGYAPFPVRLPMATRPTLAVGAELKNTFCVTREQYAFVSQYIGDLENYPTLQSFEVQIEHFKRLFRIEPELVAFDLHPGYLSTQYAGQLASSDANQNIKFAGIQHHHAHIAACLAENSAPADEDVIGIAFDGTGYGTDGAIWGGEFLIARYAGFQRAAHLAYVPLPGGDAGIKRVYRNGLAHLAHAGMEWSEDLPCVAVASETERKAIRQQLASGLNAPPTSSMGRLFDAVAAILGVREIVNYEAQAAIELEHWTVEDMEAAYTWPLPSDDVILPLVIDPAPVICSVVMDFRKQVPPWVIATKFHNAVAALVRDIAVLVRERQGLNRLALGGGVFQNLTLLTRTLALVRAAGFQVYTHHLVPPNDGGIALGQAVIANATLRDV